MARTREVHLVGSVPLRPAANVFQTVIEHLGGLVCRIPDGEQHGWLLPVWQHLANNDALEAVRQVPINPHAGVNLPVYRLRAGCSTDELVFGPYGMADNALASYAQFRELRAAGTIPPGIRFQVTLPGPGTTVYTVQVPADELLPRARDALWRELEHILSGIPAEDLTIQLDVAMEAEHEEYLRRRVPMQLPVQEVFDWTHAQMADSVAWLANRVPPAVECGTRGRSVAHGVSPRPAACHIRNHSRGPRPPPRGGAPALNGAARVAPRDPHAAAVKLLASRCLLPLRPRRAPPCETGACRQPHDR